MLILRELNLEDMEEVIKLKALCWPEELAGLSTNKLNMKLEYSFWTEWMQKADVNNDIRLLYGAFENDVMLGAAVGSFVESKNKPEDGMELNGLWVYPKHRNKGISLKLLLKLIEEFSKFGTSKVLVYNFHFAPSNAFYRHLGFNVISMEHQLKERLPVDIFACRLDALQKTLKEKLIYKLKVTFDN